MFNNQNNLAITIRQNVICLPLKSGTDGYDFEGKLADAK
jgi:hypothetical protein